MLERENQVRGEKRSLLLPAFSLLSFYSSHASSAQHDQFFPVAAFETNLLFSQHQPEVSSSVLQLSSRSGILAMVSKLTWLWNPLGEHFIQTYSMKYTRQCDQCMFKNNVH